MDEAKNTKQLLKTTLAMAWPAVLELSLIHI